MNRLTFFLLLMVTLFTKKAVAQFNGLSIGGTMVSTKGESILSVMGDVHLKNNGVFENSDTIYLTGDWINHSGTNGFGRAGEGNVIFHGDTQAVTGADVTHFHNLKLSGSGLKISDLDVVIDRELNLTDREFHLQTHTAFVRWPDLDAVLFSTGFVSSLADGGLSRAVNRDTSWVFPVGSSFGILRFRPVEIIPETAQSDTFKVRMAHVDATQEGLDRQLKEPFICEINPHFYHRIFRSGSTRADLRFYYDTGSDGFYENTAQWAGTGLWTDRQPVSATSSTPGIPPDVLELSEQDIFNPPHFALSRNSPALLLENQTPQICLGDSGFYSATPGMDNYQWFVNGQLVQDGPSSVLILSNPSDGDSVSFYAWLYGCLHFGNAVTQFVSDLPNVVAWSDTTVIPGALVQIAAAGAVAYQWEPWTLLPCPACPENLWEAASSQAFVVIGENEDGCFGTDTVRITVDEFLDPELVLHIPNAITPNDDGINDIWIIRNLELYPENEVVILNRWGSRLFEAKPYLNNWDGTHNGKRLPDGTYYFILTLRRDVPSIKGPLTILR